MRKKDPTSNQVQLGQLLAKYQTFFKPPQASVERVFCQVVTDVCGIELKPHQVTYTVATKTIHLKGPSIVRSEILQKLPLIMAVLQKELGSESPTAVV